MDNSYEANFEGFKNALKNEYDRSIKSGFKQYPDGTYRGDFETIKVTNLIFFFNEIEIKYFLRTKIIKLKIN